ncbi:MAG TPA: flagellar motor protein MotB, partial [Porphyromonadaceae bacterium]|nr:flagellar motor protein MotB [Porphyromonadaceae bacterium]
MKRVFFLSLIPALALTSCVSKKQYQLSEALRGEAMRNIENLQQELSSARSDNKMLKNRVAQLVKDTAQLGRSIRHYQELMNSNLSQQESLDASLRQKRLELDERERLINELQGIINAQNERVAQILNSVQDALLGFGSEELTVTQKDGKVYVAMSDKLLFQSGSAKLDKRGKEALEKLAEVLNSQNDIDVYIEGHTDSKPINTAQFKDNWDLSVIRATSVVRILTQEYGVNPLKVVPSGRGEFMPVD